MMNRKELTIALRGVDHMSVEDCFLLSPLFGRAADLIDQQAARIAELEALLKKTDEGWEAEAGERQKAEARADAAWIAGRDAAAEVAEKTRDRFLSDQYAANQPLGSFAERFACDMVSEAIRALTPPPEDK
jgi:nucleoside phosphorylase